MEETNKPSSESFLKKNIPISTIIIVSVLLGIIFFLTFSLIVNNSKPKITNETLGLQVKELKELTTIQYKYKNIATREDWNTLFNIKLPFTKSSFIVTYTGVLKIGIDLSETKVEVDENNKKINIILPEPKILSNDLDLSSVKVYDEKNSIFNPVKIKDYSEFTKSGKENAEADAKESGVFQQSKEVAKKVIIDLLNTTKEIKENYKIVFE
ncbi:DUF4230 domain-containing protein [Parvimonas micra]|uniref:DUF4230 domain-containing protein n=1 Tax=Parvimonas micra TaxID=33033 RepID=UPI0022B63060|nr:DUF4230 domain-containing protein [Parvimonas micra]WBB38053.1 DUF4230 domain-containing protein [Parvimonas micra]